MTPAPTFLICTVGGSPGPVVTALKQWRPSSVCFVHTPQTRAIIEAEILPKAREKGVELQADRYDFLELPDGQDLEGCVARLRQLTPRVGEWVARGQGFRVVVDFTGGTKCMSAAIGLHGSRWPCVFSYVGGDERTKNNTGIVMPEKEKVFYQEKNPWDALGHQAVEDFVVLFDQRAFLAAARIAGMAKTRVSRPDRKRELAVLEQLAKAFDAWDRFDHQASSDLLKNVEKSANDLRVLLGAQKGEALLDSLARVDGHLAALCNGRPPTHQHVVDLLANAKRRKEEGRFDDAVARLYRAIEANAQVALRDRHRIESTERVPMARVPEPLLSMWLPKVQDSAVAVGLQDAYALLGTLNDPLGGRFVSTGLSGDKSPLTARNRSILAHGFERVSEGTFDALWRAALSLADVKEESLPCFPILGGG
jgi:CRISPR-associated protein (TIGR02710 family)